MQRNIQYHLKLYYEFRPFQVLCEEFNRFTNTLMREEQKAMGPYPWLTEDDESQNVNDREKLEKYVNLGTSCLTQKEKDDILEMLCRHRDAFNLWDEIARCPNIE